MHSRNRRVDRWNRWRGLIASWSSSGLSQAEFCRRRSLRATQFSRWKRRLAAAVDPQSKGAGSRGSGVRLVPVALMGGRTAEAWDLAVILRNGREIRARGELDAAKLQRLVELLERPAC